MSRGSSRRRMLLPTRVSGLVIVVAILRTRLCRGSLHRVDDVLVTGAAAQVAFESVANFLFGGVGVVGEQLPGAQNHAGRTEAALQSVLVPECFLDRIEAAICREPFDGQDFSSI